MSDHETAAGRWILIIAIVGLILMWSIKALSQETPVCAPDNPEHCAQALKQGSPAPFTGQLLTTKLAIHQATLAHDCKEATEIEVSRAVEAIKLQLKKETALRGLDSQASEAREELFQKSLETARNASERRWWEHPGVWVGVGLIAGVAATVGAVYAGVEITKAAGGE